MHVKYQLATLIEQNHPVINEYAYTDTQTKHVYACTLYTHGTVSR